MLSRRPLRPRWKAIWTNPKGSTDKGNGKGEKTIKSSFGTFDIDTPQDRQSSF
ncbi:hypothetical protein V1387_18155 [Allomuricauda taeanensis]|nr:hypothetical protein [Allomuricauda taeanensis]